MILINLLVVGKIRIIEVNLGWQADKSKLFYRNSNDRTRPWQSSLAVPSENHYEFSSHGVYNLLFYKPMEEGS